MDSKCLAGVVHTGDLLDLLVDPGLHHQRTRLGGGLFDGPRDLRQQRTHRQHHLEGGLPLGYLHSDLVIAEGLEWTRNTLMHRFEELQADPLFPSFKGPLSSEVIKAAIAHASMPEDYERAFKRPLRMMISEDVGYVERLKDFFKYRPRELLYGYVSADVRNQLAHNPYWGPVETTTMSTVPGSLWPVEVRLHVDDRFRLPNTVESPGSSRVN